jgi:hypothetical protein
VTGFLAELGRKLADRWLDILLLPGLLWIATLTAGVRLGQQHPADVGRLRGWLDQLAAHPAAHSPATVLLAATGILLATAAAGLAAAPGVRKGPRCPASPGLQRQQGLIRRAADPMSPRSRLRRPGRWPLTRVVVEHHRLP